MQRQSACVSKGLKGRGFQKRRKKAQIFGLFLKKANKYAKISTLVGNNTDMPKKVNTCKNKNGTCQHASKISHKALEEMLKNRQLNTGLSF